MNARALLAALAGSALVHAALIVSPAWQLPRLDSAAESLVIAAQLLPAPPSQPDAPVAHSTPRKTPRARPQPALPTPDVLPPGDVIETPEPVISNDPLPPESSSQAFAELAPEPPPPDLSAWPRQGRVRYQSSYWGVPVEGEQRWTHDGASFTASLTGSVPVKGELLRQSASGHIAAGRPVSEQFNETFNRGQYDTHFAADGSKLVQTRKGNPREVPTGGYALDMLALTHFLALQSPGTQSFDIHVVTFRGSVSRVTVQQRPATLLDLPAGRTLARQFHAVSQNGKLKIDVWLSSDWRNAPVRIRVEDADGAYDLKADEVEIDGSVLARAAPGSATAD